MGLVRSIFHAILGPLLIYALLMSHIAFRTFVQTPKSISVMEFPKGTTKEMKDAVIERRKGLIKDTMDALAGKKDNFVEAWCTDDVEFEDPLQRYEGREEVQLLFDAAKRYIKSLEFSVQSEHHGPHEIVMDWTMRMTTTFLPSFTLTLPMRSHILVEPPSKTEQKERVFRITEEWYGKEQLTEETTFAVVGRIHQKLRRFVGYLGAAVLRSGYV